MRRFALKGFTLIRTLLRKNLVSVQQGFTLIEVLVVVAIIGIISGLSVFGIKDARANARDSVRKSNMEMVASALELYKLDCNKYPDVLPSPGQALTGKNPSGRCKTSNIYIASMPADPQGPSRFYNYYSPPNNKSYELCSSLEKSTGNTVTCGGSSVCGSQIGQSVPDFRLGKEDVLANLSQGNQGDLNLELPYGVGPNPSAAFTAVQSCGGKANGTFCYLTDYLPWTYAEYCPGATPGANWCGGSNSPQSPPNCGSMVLSTCQSNSCSAPPASKTWTIRAHPVCPDGSPNSSGNIVVGWSGSPMCTRSSGSNNSVTQKDTSGPGVHTVTISTSNIVAWDTGVGYPMVQRSGVSLWVERAGTFGNLVPVTPLPNSNMRVLGGNSNVPAVGWYPALVPAGTYDLNFTVPTSWCGGGPTSTPTPTPTGQWGTSTPTPQPAVCNYKVTSP